MGSSSIKLSVDVIKQSCMRASKDFSDELAKCREPIIQTKMKGTFGLFKLTRNQAIDRLENGSCWSDYHCCQQFSIVPRVVRLLLFLANNSQDGFVYVCRGDFGVISSYIGECDGN